MRGCILWPAPISRDVVLLEHDCCPISALVSRIHLPRSLHSQFLCFGVLVPTIACRWASVAEQTRGEMWRS